MMLVVSAAGGLSLAILFWRIAKKKSEGNLLPPSDFDVLGGMGGHCMAG